MSVDDCVRSHIAWITLCAREGGGEVGREGGVDWAYVPGSRTMHLLFPTPPHPEEVRAIVVGADALGAVMTAVWSAVDRHRPWLREMGFRRAWQPWWMAAAPSDVPLADRGRVRLVTRPRPHDPGREALAGRPDVLLAEATVDGAYAGRAWLHLDGEVAGLYDMAVWPDFQRRGLGRELLGALAAEAGRRGATTMTLNATPEGAPLYTASGFRRLGEGRTWWRRRP